MYSNFNFYIINTGKFNFEFEYSILSVIKELILKNKNIV